MTKDNWTSPQKRETLRRFTARIYREDGVLWLTFRDSKRGCGEVIAVESRLPLRDVNIDAIMNDGWEAFSQHTIDRKTEGMSLDEVSAMYFDDTASGETATWMRHSDGEYIWA